MRKRKLAALLIVLVLLSGILPAGAASAAAPAAARRAETNTVAGTDTVAVRPEIKSVAAGETFTVDVKIEGSAPVIASDVQILFDTDYLEGVSVASSGKFTAYFIDKSDLAHGKIWFGGGSGTPLAPPFKFATLTFKAKARLGDTALAFNRAETDVEGTYGSVLGSTVDGQVSISAPAGKDTVFVQPQSKTVLAGQTFSVDVKIDGDAALVSSDVQILFDTAMLEGVSVTSSGAFTSYFIDNSDLPNGVIWFGGGALNPISPPLTFAKLVFRAKQTLGTTDLAFNLAETDIEGQAGSVLGATQGGQVTVGATTPDDIVAVRPSVKAVNAGDTFTVDVKIEGTQPLVSSDVQILFDTAMLEGVSVANSGVLGAYWVDKSDLANGEIWFGGGSYSPVSPSFTFATLTFKAKQHLGSTGLAFNWAETDVEGLYGSVLGGTLDGQVTIGVPPGKDSVVISPQAKTVYAGQTFAVDVKIEGSTPMVSSDVQFLFDPTKLQAVSVTPTGVLGDLWVDKSDFAAGKIWFGGGSLADVTPPFTFATVVFTAKQALGTAGLTFNTAETDIESTTGTVFGGVQDGEVTIVAAPAGKDVVAIRPAARSVLAGETFKVDVAIEGPAPVVSSDVQILFDTTMLEGVSVNDSGAFTSYFIDKSDLPAGKVWFGGGNGTALSPNITFATLIFKAKQTLGSTTLAFNGAETDIENTTGSVLGWAQDGYVGVATTTNQDIVAIRPETKSVATDETFTVDVKIEGPLPLVGTDVQIKFDTAYLEGVSVVSSGVLPDLWVDKSDLAHGVIWFGAGKVPPVPPDPPAPVVPPITVATLTFKSKQQVGVTDLKFNLLETDIEAQSGSVLSGAIDGQVTIGQPDVSVVPAAATVAGCATTTADIMLNQFYNAKSADVTLTFDATRLTVVDQDAGTPGTQIAAVSTFLAADSVTANIACNEVDLAIPECDTPAEVGTIHYAAADASAPWATGSGPIARITFRPVGDGASALDITASTVLNNLGAAITHTETDGSLSATALAAPVVTISKISATTAQLGWGPIALADGYAIWRQTAPYYTPVNPSYTTVAASPWDDTSALGSTTEEYYYYVKGACTDGWTGGKSNHVGAFDFALVKGSP